MPSQTASGSVRRFDFCRFAARSNVEGAVRFPATAALSVEDTCPVPPVTKGASAVGVSTVPGNSSAHAAQDVNISCLPFGASGGTLGSAPETVDIPPFARAGETER